MPEMKTWTANGVMYKLPFAPEGYGLGGAVHKSISEIDTLVYPGYYMFSEPITINGGVYYSPFLWVAGRDENFATQWLCPDGTGDVQFTRTIHNGVWHPWVECGVRAFAPAGYGLGVSDAPYHLTETMSDLDNFIQNGWYAVQTTFTISGTTWYFIKLHVQAYNGMNVMQEVNPNGTNYILRRFCHDGTWGEWEWENPPMVSNVEYRITERWRGSPVYTKLVDFGNLPANASRHIPVGINGQNICTAYGSAYSNTGEYVPIHMGCNGVYAAYFWVDPSGELYVRTMQDLSVYAGVFVLKYVKS